VISPALVPPAFTNYIYSPKYHQMTDIIRLLILQNI
jgi:hypothetical protein